MNLYTLADLTRRAPQNRRQLQWLADQGVLRPVEQSNDSERLFDDTELDLACLCWPLSAMGLMAAQLKAVTLSVRATLEEPDPEIADVGWGDGGLHAAFKAARAGEQAWLAIPFHWSGNELKANPLGFCAWPESPEANEEEPDHFERFRQRWRREALEELGQGQAVVMLDLRAALARKTTADD